MHSNRTDRHNINSSGRDRGRLAFGSKVKRWDIEKNTARTFAAYQSGRAVRRLGSDPKIVDFPERASIVCRAGGARGSNRILSVTPEPAGGGRTRPPTAVTKGTVVDGHQYHRGMRARGVHAARVCEKVPHSCRDGVLDLLIIKGGYY